MERVVGYAPKVPRYYGVNPGDLLIAVNAYGINPVTIDTALECKRPASRRGDYLPGAVRADRARREDATRATRTCLSWRTSSSTTTRPTARRSSGLRASPLYARLDDHQPVHQRAQRWPANYGKRFQPPV